MNFERGLLRRMGLASTAVGAFLCAALPMATPAQADGDNIFSPVTNFFKSPFGGGKAAADNSNNGAIDYRPRPALVVPPSYDLPPPQAPAARAADWPKERDAAALRKARADSRRPAPPTDSSAGDGASSEDGGAPSQDAAVAPNEPTRSANCTSVVGTPVCVSTPWANVDLPNLGKIPGLNLIPGLNKPDQESAADIRLNPHPTRKYLTDPPVDYMEAVQVPQEKQAAAKGQDKAQAEDQKVTRAPPAIDRTPPGK